MTEPRKKGRRWLKLSAALLLPVLAAGGWYAWRVYTNVMDNERYVVGRLDTRQGYYAQAHLGTAAPAGAALPPADPASLTRPPNIIVIMADDLGWSDVSTLGVGRVPTPNIDRIAQWGVAFANGYVTAPMCAPSRAGLLTGRHQQRFGFEFNIAENRTQQQETADHDGEPVGLPANQPVLAERLHDLGYATALVGKWHQGFDPAQHPLRRGFDRFYGFLPGTMSYARTDDPGILSFKPSGGIGDPRPPTTPVIFDGEKPVDIQNGYYLTEAITEQAVSFIEANRDRPFYLHVAHHAPHLPFQVPRRYAERFPGVESPEMRIYFGMIAAMDDSIGAILDRLERDGLRQNTLILFTSDNGCAVGKGVCGCDPIVNAGKFSMVEGGLRVPFLMGWPARLPPSGIVAGNASTLDVATTALAAAGVADLPAELDGRDLMQHMGDASRPLFWRAGRVAAVRRGDWKLRREGDDTKLFDLSADPGERHDLRAQRPEVAADLTRLLDEWDKGLAEPRWTHPQLPWRVCGRWTTGTQ